MLELVHVSGVQGTMKLCYECYECYEACNTYMPMNAFMRGQQATRKKSSEPRVCSTGFKDERRDGSSGKNGGGVYPSDVNQEVRH